jgi:hypothetical protein
MTRGRQRHPALDEIPALVESDPGHQADYYRRKLGIASRHTFRHEMTRLSQAGVLTFDRRPGDNVCLWKPAEECRDVEIIQQLTVRSWAPPRVPPGPRSIFELSAPGSPNSL